MFFQAWSGLPKTCAEKTLIGLDCDGLESALSIIKG
jgi:hypothetical protein